MVVYLDVVFLENFFMDLVILLAVGVCMKVGGKVWRICLAACTGAIFYILQFFVVWITWLQFLIGAFMVVISFGFSGIRILLKQLCLFYFVSFVFGGVSFGLMSCLNHGKFSIFDGAVVGNFSLAWIVLASIVGFILVLIVLRRKAKHVLVDVVISVGGREANARILLDTGNLLKEPYGGRPVMIVQKDAIRDIFDDVLIDRFHDILEGRDNIPIGMFFIPYRSLGNRSRPFTRV